MTTEIDYSGTSLTAGRVGLVLAGLLATQTSALAQHLSWMVTAPPHTGGRQVVVSDLNGDGTADIATVAALFFWQTQQWRTEIRTLSGADGSWLPWSVRRSRGDSYSRLVPHGDVNGDGAPDFLVRGIVRGVNGIHAYCGRSLQVIYQIPQPSLPQGAQWGGPRGSIVGGPDIDNDGFADVIVSDPWFWNVYAYDRTGSLIYQTRSVDGANWQFVGAFEDHDGDGHDDFLVTVYEWSSLRTGAEIISGATGQPIRRVLGQPSDYLDQVTGCGDLDADGKMDILLGGGNFAPGTVQAYSSVTSQRLWAWYSGWTGDYFGQIMLGTVDIDQDGLPDPMATSLSQPAYPGGPGGYVSIYNGRDGSEYRFFDNSGQTSASSFGYLTAVPAQPGSTLSRFLVTANRWGVNPTTNAPISRTYMFEAGPAGATTVALGCPGTLPNTPRIGLRQIAPQQSRVTLSGAEPGTPAFLVLGIGGSPQPLALGQFGFANCDLHPARHSISLVLPGTTGVDAGYGYRDFPHDFRSSAAQGTLVTGQFVVLGTGNHAPGGTTAALSWFFQ